MFHDKVLFEQMVTFFRISHGRNAAGGQSSTIAALDLHQIAEDRKHVLDGSVDLQWRSLHAVSGFPWPR
jgi:hypothetical protein